MQIIPEIDVKGNLRRDIEKLRKNCFPDFSVGLPYYKQLPHYRAVTYLGNDVGAYIWRWIIGRLVLVSVESRC